VPTDVEREGAYGQYRPPSPVDRFGVWLNARAISRRAPFAGSRIADLGCGFNATVTRPLLGRVASATLVDVALAPDLKGHSKVTAHEGLLPGALADCPDGGFDVVMMLNILEHLWEPEEALGHARRMLAPGGTLLVNVPSWRGKTFLELAAFRFGVSPVEEINDHKRYYDPRDLWPLLVSSGFPPQSIRCRRHKLGLNTLAVARVPKGNH
jgi:SAM-dependent methyltransferase